MENYKVADLPKNYFLNNSEKELSSDDVAELLKINVTAYDMFLVRNNLHALRSKMNDNLNSLNIKVDDGLSKVFTCLEDIKKSLEVEFNNGSVKTSKINDVILEHHNDIKKVKTILEDLDKKKQDKGLFKSTVRNVSWWSDNLIKIALLIAMVLAYLGISDIYSRLDSLPK